MTREQARAAIEVGLAVATELVADGYDCLVTGDMGIANTTPAAALIAAFTGAPAMTVTGRGTGVDDEMLAHKTTVVTAALELHQPDRTDPIGVLAAVGGLEHAALTGFILGAAALRLPVILDGVIAVFGRTRRGRPGAGFDRRGQSPGIVPLSLVPRWPWHTWDWQPLVDLGLRLGEGTGALLAAPIVASAARVLHDVATFDSAGVAEK